MTGTSNMSAPQAPAPAQPLFDPVRMRRYPLLVLAIFLISAVALVMTSDALTDFRGKPLGCDFITFWGASDLTLQSKPEAAFDAAQTLASQRKAVAHSEVAFYWHYPPTFQLLVAPLALLPYALSYLVFIALGFAAYLVALRPLLNQPNAGLILAAFPAALLCLCHGQNSLFSAALVAGAIYLSERGARGALLAGVCIGLLAYKPQLGILMPFALAAAGQWRIFFAAAVATLAFAGAATLAFGPDLWRVFIDNLPFVRELVESGALPWAKMPSAFVFLRYFGVPELFAYGAQAAVILTAFCVTLYVWRRCGMTRLSWAVLVVATLMIPHYLFDYELTLLAVPLAILGSDMAVRGASRSEKAILLACFVLTGVTAPLTEGLNVQIGFPLLATLLWFTTRQALLSAGPAARPLLGWGSRARAA